MLRNFFWRNGIFPPSSSKMKNFISIELYQIVYIVFTVAIYKFPILLLHKILQKFYILNNSFNSIVFALYFCNSIISLWIILISNKILRMLRNFFQELDNIMEWNLSAIFLENEKFYIHCVISNCLHCVYSRDT